MSAVKTFLVFSTVALLTAVAGYLHQKRKRKIVIPKHWQPVGKVIKLYIYPVKSGHRYELKQGQITNCGFKEVIDEVDTFAFRDRQFLVYNAYDHEFRTARTYPKLVLVEIMAIDASHIIVKAPEMETITLEIPTSEKSKAISISLWNGEKLNSLDCGDEISKWVSRFLLGKDSGLRLGYHDGNFKRCISQSHSAHMKVFDRLSNEVGGMYSDVGNYNLINQSSVDDLNMKIEEGLITANNFRPNILIEGADPYAEDGWDVLKIGDVIFHHVMPCTRCILTTVDPEKGERTPNREPLTTLLKYRILEDPAKRAVTNNSPAMGVYINPITQGIVHVGDEVFIGKSA